MRAFGPCRKFGIEGIGEKTRDGENPAALGIGPVEGRCKAGFLR